MADREIKVIISAEDDYSAKLRKFNAALGEAGQAAGGFGNSTDKVTKQLGKLGDMNEYAALGLRRLQSLATGFAFGAVIGAVSSLTEMLIENYKASSLNADKLRELNNSIITQAEGWKLLPPVIGGATTATVDYFNARLRLAQFESVLRRSEIEEEIRGYEAIKKNYEFNLKAAPSRVELGRKVEEYNIKLAALRVEQERLNWVMSLTPQTVEKIGTALEESTRKIETALPAGGGSLMAFVLGDLDMAAPKFELAGISVGEWVGKGMVIAGQTAAVNFVEIMKTTIENAGDQLDFKMDPDYQPSLERFFAYSDTLFTAQEELDNALLDRHIKTSDQMISTEEKLKQTKTNLQFAAANNAVALLSILGGKHKEFALIALAAQKGLAMAQVFISGKVAATAALAPPPVGLGPVAGAGLAGSIEAYTYWNMGLIAATGLVEGLMGGGGGPSGIGGGGGIGALPIQPPDIMSSRPEDVKPPLNITLIVNTLDGADVNWAKIMEDNIAPALENYSKDGNRPLNITVSQAN